MQTSPTKSVLTLYSENATIVPHRIVGTLAVDGWVVTFGTARRELGGAAGSVSGQCTNQRIAV